MKITIKHNEIRSCELCKYHYKDTNEYPCNTCIHNAIEKFTPMTNFDKIKGMSVEELAKFLATPCECDVDPEKDGYVECGNELCIERIVKWLNSNVI
jgi:hypothetical protein